MKYYDDKRIILVDGYQTYLLRSWVSDNGIIVEVSGPESLYFHEHNITEVDGSQLDLTNDIVRVG